MTIYKNNLTVLDFSSKSWEFFFTSYAHKSIPNNHRILIVMLNTQSMEQK